MNVSPVELRDERFVATLLQVLAGSQLTPGTLVFEITEGLLVPHGSALERCLEGSGMPASASRSTTSARATRR